MILRQPIWQRADLSMIHVNYNDYMQDITDKLVLIQDDLNRTHNYSDTALEYLLHDTNNTNAHTNTDPDCITEDDLDFGREKFSDNKLPDVNFPHKKWGYIVTEDNFFSFIGPDITCV